MFSLPCCSLLLNGMPEETLEDTQNSLQEMIDCGDLLLQLKCVSLLVVDKQAPLLPLPISMADADCFATHPSRP